MKVETKNLPSPAQSQHSKHYTLQTSIDYTQTLADRYADPNMLVKDINEYFQYVVETNRYPTLAGLARHVGIKTDDLRNYPENDPNSYPFPEVMHAAKQIIEEACEEYMFYGRNASSVQLLLKNNFGYSDKITHNHNNQSLTDILDEIEKDNAQIIDSPQ